MPDADQPLLLEVPDQPSAIVPSYNAQISTEAEHKLIVGAHLSQSSSDA